METGVEEQQESHFHSLAPETVITLVEEALGRYCTNLFRPLNSYINRVFELEEEDGAGLIVKFYRPGRWHREALLEEHTFLLELDDLEIPVIAPLRLQNEETLGRYKDVAFALFPKCGGRNFDEYSEEQWLELGRLLGRFHRVGEQKQCQHRLVMHPERSTRSQVDYLLDNGLVPSEQTGLFKELTDRLITEITPLFEGQQMIRIHGDCHFSNIIHRPGESFFLIDLDDMAMGPPVQDFWMLLPGPVEESRPELALFLEGYETFRKFDRRGLKLIEPLRAMRFIHYMAWCGHQVVHDGHTLVNSDFGSFLYWQAELQDLSDQLQRIGEIDDHDGNSY